MDSKLRVSSTAKISSLYTISPKKAKSTSPAPASALKTPNNNNIPHFSYNTSKNEFIQQHSNALSYIQDSSAHDDYYMNPIPSFCKPSASIGGYKSDPEVEKLIKRIQIANYNNAKAACTNNHHQQQQNQNQASGAGNSMDLQQTDQVYKFKCTFSGTVSDAMRRRGWIEAADGEDDWHIYWCDMNQFRELFSLGGINKQLEEYQRIGHFKNSIEISRKNLMARNLKRFKSKMEKLYGKAEGEKLNFFPTTFVLPDEHTKFVEEFRREASLWIIKPAAGAQGRGIFIFAKLKEYYDWRARFDPFEYRSQLLQQIQQDQAQQKEMEQISQEKSSSSSFIPPSAAASTCPETEPNPIPNGMTLAEYIEPVLPGGIQVSVYVEPPPTARQAAVAADDSMPPSPDSLSPPNTPNFIQESSNDIKSVLSNYVPPCTPIYERQIHNNISVQQQPTRTPLCPGSIPSSSTNGPNNALLDFKYNLPIDSSSTTASDASIFSTANNEPTSAQLLQPMISKHDIYVIQRYIPNPYLLGGRKFDIRLYVLVQSFTPLKAWIYRDGFARFSGGQFNLASLQDIYVHLTNVAIQRTSDNYNHQRGSKWSLNELRQYLLAMHGLEIVNQLMNHIDNIVIRTLQSVQQAIQQDNRCFEIYGFDILIDRDLKPWLLEVNSSPAFTPSSEEDYRLKCALIDDAVHVLDVEQRLTGFEKRVGGFDLFWNDGPVYATTSDMSGNLPGIDDAPKLNSYLGCHNDRITQLYDLMKSTTYAKEAHLVHNLQQCDEITPRKKQNVNTKQQRDEYLSDAASSLRIQSSSTKSTKPTKLTKTELSSKSEPTIFTPINIHDLRLSTRPEDLYYRVPERRPFTMVNSFGGANGGTSKSTSSSTSNANANANPLSQLKSMSSARISNFPAPARIREQQTPKTITAADHWRNDVFSTRRSKAQLIPLNLTSTSSSSSSSKNKRQF